MAVGLAGWGGDAPSRGDVTRNDATCNTAGVALNDFASVRSTPGPATDVACPSGQQLVQVRAQTSRQTSRGTTPSPAAVAPDSIRDWRPWCAWPEAMAGAAAK